MRFSRCQKHGKGILVPSENETENGCRRNTCGCLRQHNLSECLKPRIAVDHCSFFIFARYLVDKTFQKPHGKRNIHSGVEQNHAQFRIRQSKFPVHEVNRYRYRNWRHHPCGQDEKQQVIF